MQKVITINLNGHAYQLDESGYDALRDYLAGAMATLVISLVNTGAVLNWRRTSRSGPAS